MISKPKSPKIKKKSSKVSITKQQSSDYELIASAYHEAAHTVVALANLVLVDNVSVAVNFGGDTLYSSLHADYIEDNELKKLIVLAEIRIFYSGLVGEKIFYMDICGNPKIPMSLKIGSSEDNKEASFLIRKYSISKPGKETFELKKNIKSEIEKFLYNHWGSIKIIAHSLYKRKKLNYSEIKYLLSRSPDDKEFWKDKFKKIKIIHNENKKLSEKIVKKIISSRFGK